jgi:hypothetical protein
MRILNIVRSAQVSMPPVWAVLASLALGGCQAPLTGPGASLAADPSDPCQPQRAAFAGSKTYFQDQITAGAVNGAAVGGATGALAGLAAGGNLKSALIGGLAGAAVGGVVGGSSAYYNTLAERARDQNELAYAMNQDLAREGQEIDHTTAAFARLRACRFGQAYYVKTQAKQHIIDRQTALARIAYHRAKFDEEIQIAQQFGLTMAHRGQQFQEAANDLRTRPPAPPANAPSGTVATRASPARVAAVDKAATVSVPEKRASYNDTVASAAKSSKAAFDLDNNASLSWLSPTSPDA